MSSAELQNFEHSSVLALTNGAWTEEKALLGKSGLNTLQCFKRTRFTGMTQGLAVFPWNFLRASRTS